MLFRSCGRPRAGRSTRRPGRGSACRGGGDPPSGRVRSARREHGFRRASADPGRGAGSGLVVGPGLQGAVHLALAPPARAGRGKWHRSLALCAWVRRLPPTQPPPPRRSLALPLPRRCLGISPGRFAGWILIHCGKPLWTMPQPPLAGPGWRWNARWGEWPRSSGSHWTRVRERLGSEIGRAHV